MRRAQKFRAILSRRAEHRHATDGGGGAAAVARGGAPAGFQRRALWRGVEVELGAKLRDERKFSSPAELREQIQRDVAAVRAAT